MRAVAILILVAAGVAAAWAEDVVLPADGVVTVPIRVSTPNQVYPRTIVFPTDSIGDIPQLFSEQDLFVQQIRNTLVLHLKTADFGGTLQVFDASGRLYLLNVVPAQGDQPVPEKLRITLPQPPPVAAAGMRHNIVEEAMAMFDHMLGFRRRPDVSSVDATVIRDGEVSVGRRIYEDDDVQILVTRIHQGPALRGYECVFTYRGEEPRYIPYQRIYFPGAIAVYAGQGAFMDPANPGRDVRPGQSIRVYYVAQ